MKNKGKVWMRLGDNGDYEDFDSMSEAGERLGDILGNSRVGLPPPTMSDIGRYAKYGIEAPGFYGANYISLFWGDDDAQPLKDFTQADLADLKRGVREGADMPYHRPSRYTVTNKTAGAGRSRKSSGETGVGRVR